ncbi:MAG TPA: hypothetical protein VM406_12095 [Noviherbaspirillum sp.]|nr:hypothetical protein [Noviherbaspirillum sp.]
MLSTEQACSRALVTGSVAAAITAAAAAVAGRRQTGSYAAPLNATSHILWGEDATWRNRATLKYTGTGLLLTHAAGVFWASVYEKLFGRADDTSPPSPLLALAGAAAVSAGAWLTDYHLVPRRFTPGYERRVSDRALAGIFTALAIGLAARDLWRAARS